MDPDVAGDWNVDRDSVVTGNDPDVVVGLGLVGMDPVIVAGWGLEEKGMIRTLLLEWCPDVVIGNCGGRIVVVDCSYQRFCWTLDVVVDCSDRCCC